MPGLRPKQISRFYYGALASLVLATVLFDVYHITHVIQYGTRYVGAVRPPFATEPGIPIVTAAREEAIAAGIRNGDTLLEVDGQPVNGRRVLDRAVIPAKPGTSLVVTAQRNTDAPRRAVVPLVAQQRDPGDNWYTLLLIAVVLPLSCQLLGFWAVAARPLDPRTWLLLLCSLGFGLRIVLTTEFREGTWLSAYALGYRIALVDTYYGWLLWLMLRFPHRHAIDVRASWLKWTLFAPLAGLTALRILFQLAIVFDYAVAAVFLPSAAAVRTLSSQIGGVCLAASVVLLSHRFLTERTADTRRRLRLFFAGTLLALAPSEALVQIGRVTGLGIDEFPWHVQLVCLLMTLLFPVTVAYTIVIPRAPDLIPLVRQNLNQLLSRRGAIAVHAALAVAALALLTGANAGASQRVWLAAALLFLSLLTRGSLFARTRTWMDRNVFRDTHQVEAALHHSEGLARDFLDPRTLMEKTQATLASAFDVERVTALLDTGEGLRPIDAATPGFALPQDSVLARRLAANPSATTTYFDDSYSWMYELPDEERSWLQATGADVLVPVVDGTRVAALLCMGPKPLQAPYSASELGMLTLVARQTSLAMKNSNLLAQVSAEIANRERIRREKETAEAASRAKTAFLASMSHELRTPMNAIIGYSEMLIEDAEERGADDTLADLRKIQSAGKHLLDLINSVLDISKIEAGKMEVYVETFAIEEVVQNVLHIATPLAAKNGNTVVVEMPSSIKQMSSDRTKLRQALFNLIGNASKFTKNGTITLRVGRETVDRRGWTTFAVADTGIGMTSEQLARLFQPFTQADAAIAGTYGGTGLGLTITKQFCEMLGGSIHVASEYGKGTTFTMRLPSETAPARRVEVPPAEGAIEPGAPAVLLIDDDPVVHDQLRRLLAKSQVRVLSAFDGERGIELASTAQPRAILLDVIMNGVDGWQVLARLKTDQRLSHIPVLMMTVVDQRNAGYALGAREYLVKPVSRDQLAHVIGSYCAPSAEPHVRASVLVVDDEPDTRRALRRMLEGFGWDVVEAGDGREALAAVAVRPPHLILLDLMMPVMDGFAFMDELRQRREYQSTPIVVVTAKDLTADERARLTGAVSRIVETRGFDRDALLAHLHQQVLEFLRVQPSGS